MSGAVLVQLLRAIKTLRKDVVELKKIVPHVVEVPREGEMSVRGDPDRLFVGIYRRAYYKEADEGGEYEADSLVPADVEYDSETMYLAWTADWDRLSDGAE